MSTFTVGCFVEFQHPKNSANLLGGYQPEENYRLQNFYINQSVDYEGKSYRFVPFSFSGVTVNRTGDNLEASLLFPNNEITRCWADSAIRQRWLVTVDVVALEADAPGEATEEKHLVHTYIGQVVTGAWKSAQLELALGSVLDAVGADVPRRNLTQDFVGRLPSTSNVTLQ